MAVVEKLDVSGFCAPIRAREGRAGRNATDPHLLVGLWLYGCVRGIGSARELAHRCEESVPFRWLCRRGREPLRRCLSIPILIPLFVSCSVLPCFA